MDSTQALWFADSRNWIPDSSFVELGFGFQTLAAFRIPLAEVLILRQGIPDSTSKNLPGIQSLAYLTRSGKLFILLPVIIGYVWRSIYVTGDIKKAFLLIVKTVSRSRTEDGIINIIVQVCLVSFTWIVTLGYFVE